MCRHPQVIKLVKDEEDAKAREEGDGGGRGTLHCVVSIRHRILVTLNMIVAHHLRPAANGLAIAAT